MSTSSGPRPSFGDRVRIVRNPTTEQSGHAGREGTLYGFTTPSITEPEVIGPLTQDYAVSVGFEGLGEAWFVEEYVEFIDHSPGLEASLGDLTFVRTDDGGWAPAGAAAASKSTVGRLLERLRRRGPNSRR